MRRLVPVALLCFGACSQLGSEPPQGPTPDLGLLPLAAETLRFCRSGSALVGSGAVGFCVPAGSTPAACGACGPREVCRCGRCALGACSATPDCPAGTRCRRGRCDPACAVDGDCAFGAACRDGVCLAACDGGCRRGERCEAGRCEAALCRGDADCGAGERCELAREPVLFAEPSVVPRDGGWLLAVEERLPAGSRIVLARSPDGASWEVDPSPALVATRAWEEGSVGAPALLEGPGGSLTLLYEGGDGAGIGIAEAPPGGPFVAQPEPVLAPAEPWEEGAVGGPSPLPDAPGFLYDAGRAAAPSGDACADDAGCRAPLERCRAGRCRALPRVLGIARVEAGRVTRARILSPEEVESASARRVGDGGPGVPLWAGLRALHSPAAVPARSAAGERIVLLFYAGVGVERPGAPANRSIGLATSRDGRAFRAYPYNPVVARQALFTQPLGESGPWALLSGGVLRVYFDAVDPSGAPQLPGLAASAPEGVPGNR